MEYGPWLPKEKKMKKKKEGKMKSQLRGNVVIFPIVQRLSGATVAQQWRLGCVLVGF